MKRFFTACLALIVVATGFAKVELGIVNRQQFYSLWRFDFNYETTDTDGKTPITLSAAIFMSGDIHDKKKSAKGCVLMNHYTITTDEERPTNVSNPFSLEGVVAAYPFFVVESDGIGFGITKNRKQSYLEGRTAARNDIDAFLCARKLLEEEGYDVPDVVANLGYSQGGHSGMWVNRLVAEGYRSDELPKIDISILGGGPYDIYSHYRYLVDTGVTQYPVAIPLIANGVIESGKSGVGYEDLFKKDFIAHIPSWFDSKKYTTTDINDSIYRTMGDAQSQSIEIGKMMSEDFLNPECEMMQRVGQWMKDNSLVYDDWIPSKTDTILFVHSKNDEVVPYLNMESMERFLLEHNYKSFSVNSSYEAKHTPTGTYFALLAATTLDSYVPKKDVPTGICPNASTISADMRGDVYSIEGKLVRKNMSVSSMYNDLPKGIYIINGRKVVVK